MTYTIKEVTTTNPDQTTTTKYQVWVEVDTIDGLTGSTVVSHRMVTVLDTDALTAIKAFTPAA